MKEETIQINIKKDISKLSQIINYYVKSVILLKYIVGLLV